MTREHLRHTAGYASYSSRSTREQVDNVEVTRYGIGAYSAIHSLRPITSPTGVKLSNVTSVSQTLLVPAFLGYRHMGQEKQELVPAWGSGVLNIT